MSKLSPASRVVYQSAALSSEEHAIDWRPPEDESRGRALIFRFLPLLFLCVCAFAPAWTSKSFLWQDNVEVTLNNPLRSGAGLGLLWVAPTVTPHWAPLAYTFLWPQRLIWTDKVQIGYHLVSLLLHATNALLVWLLLKRLEIPGAFFAAMVFAIHPVQAETAGWIAQQPVLFGAFWSLSFLLVAARWTGVDATRPNGHHVIRLPEEPVRLYILLAMTYVLAVLASPLQACVLPIVAGLWAWWKSNEFPRRAWRGMALLMVIGIAGLVVHWIAEKHRAAWPYSVGQSIALIPQAIGFYLSKAAWPSGLSVVQRLDISVFGGSIAAVVLVAVLALLWARRQTLGRTPFVVAATYVLFLLPMMTPLNRQAIADAPVAERYQYLALAVFVGSVIGSIAHFGELQFRNRRWIWPAAATVVPLTLAVIVCISFAPAFASKQDMWDRALQIDPDNVPALIFAAQTSATQKDGKDAATKYYSTVLRLTNQTNIDAFIGLGDLYSERGDFAEAATLFEQAMAAAPHDPAPVEKLGVAMVKMNKTDDALKLYADAVKTFPADIVLWRQQGEALLQQGKAADALVSLKKGMAINNYDAATHLAAATCYYTLHDAENFKIEVNDAFKLDPENYDFFMSVATMCVRDHELEYAQLYYRRAAQLRPDAPEASNNVGLVLAMQSQQLWLKGESGPALDKTKEAEVALNRAIEINPDFASAKQNLDVVHHLQDRIRAGPPPKLATRPSSQPATKP